MITGSVSGRSAYLGMLSQRYVNFVESEFPPRLLRLVSERWPSVVVRALVYSTSWFTSHYLRNRSAVPPEDRIDIQYETLCDRPNETIARILANLGFAGCRRDYPGMIGENASRVAPEVAANRDLILRKLSDYAAAVGYDLSELAEQLNQRQRAGGREMWPEPLTTGFQGTADNTDALNPSIAARGESRRSMLYSVHHQNALIGEVREDCNGDGATETRASGGVLGSDQ
jgi:hypothetical protein